jgi:hypothetical protein
VAVIRWPVPKPNPKLKLDREFRCGSIARSSLVGYLPYTSPAYNTVIGSVAYGASGTGTVFKLSSAILPHSYLKEFPPGVLFYSMTDRCCHLLRLGYSIFRTEKEQVLGVDLLYRGPIVTGGLAKMPHVESHDRLKSQTEIRV